jgi:hypothetical protein
MSNNSENPFKDKEVLGKLNEKVKIADEGASLQKYVIVAVVAFALGYGVNWIGQRNDVKSDSDDSKLPISSPSLSSSSSDIDAALKGEVNYLGTEEPLIAANILMIEDQPAGLEVFVKKIDLPKSGWLAIREDNGKGEPGNILGAQLFDPGMTSGKVELLRNTEEGKIYYAMILSDNGDRAFIPKMDLPVLGIDGQPLSVSFKTTR